MSLPTEEPELEVSVAVLRKYLIDLQDHHIALQKTLDNTSPGDEQIYKLIVKKTNYQKVVATYTASLTIEAGQAGFRNLQFNNAKNLWIPGSGSFLANTSHSMALWSGSVQELKLWTNTLQDSILDNHALAPTSFQGNLVDTHTGSTSSFYSLAYRLTLGSDNKKTDLIVSSSVSSSHPNQSIKQPTSSFYHFTGSYYNPITEIHSLEWPDLGGNRSVGTKIRIESTSTAGETELGNTIHLWKDNSAQ